MAAAPAVRLPVFGLVRLLGLAAAAAIVVWAVHFRGGMAFSSETDKLLIFNVHPVLMLIGLVVFNGEALLAYKTVPGTKKLKKLVHLALQFLAMLLSLIGLWTVWKFHNEREIDHLYTLHSWLGLACIIFFSLQWATGFYTFWYPGGSRSGRASLLPWHVFFGLFLYVLAIATSVSGLLEKSIFMQSAKMIGRFSTEALFMNSLGMLLVLLGALVILAVVSPGSGKIDTYRGSSE
ncbi:probable transmembrane ascorbate ferrireductase 2 [Oryza brachyantha]|uniref:probable transmembrane ascorbate ferrireductase 2 n=1 Tax=Oryza brachyantha TaxID=4533 RepID=UPI0003EAA640|nr:probable transmembrane ascorbate ferrireductase 2 [Oryza brachyantha]